DHECGLHGRKDGTTTPAGTGPMRRRVGARTGASLSEGRHRPAPLDGGHRPGAVFRPPARRASGIRGTQRSTGTNGVPFFLSSQYWHPPVSCSQQQPKADVLTKCHIRYNLNISWTPRRLDYPWKEAD